MFVNSPKELALLVVNQRKKLGLTQAQVGDKVGLKQKTISAFENNPATVKLSTAFLIISSLELCLDASLKDNVTSNNLGGWDQPW